MKVRFVPLVLLSLAAACTSSAAPRSPAGGASSVPASPTSPSPEGPSPILLDVVATLTSTGGEEAVRDDATYVDGMRLAVAVVNEKGGVAGRPLQLRFHDDLGRPATARDDIAGALGDQPVAVLYVGPGTALPPLRERLDRTGTPVILLQGDLYTSRQLFPEVIQTTIPWVWQAKVIARYLVIDRQAKDIRLIGAGPEAPGAETALRGALAYWDGRLAAATTYPRGALVQLTSAMRGADAVVAFGPPSAVGSIAATAASAGVRARAVGAAAALPASGDEIPLVPGTTACYTYTWAGWAEPIERVGEFIDRFEREFGHPPVGFEQEGYDAVRALAYALERSGGGGGRALLRALEDIHGVAFSSFPIDLGPDDHVFLPRDELGLFAVPGPKEKLDPWQERGPELWRPVMRTFTYDGQRDNVLDRDKRVFFPFWRKHQPSPKYWRSRYGITSTPKDPLH